MHGAQRIGGGEQEGDKGSTGSGGIGKKTTSRTQHKNYSRDNRHQYQQHK